MLDKPLVRLIIAGGRDYDNYNELERVTDYMLSNLIATHKIVIVSGGARGADSLAVQYAQIRGYELITMPADWEVHGRSAGYIRNAQMAEVATHLLAFWDGKSRGTKHMIDIAHNMKIKVHVSSY